MERTGKTDWLRRLSRISGLAVAGTFALAPLFGAPATAKADPPDHAPAWGNRGKDAQWRNRRDRDDRDWRDRDWRNRDSRNRDSRNRNNGGWHDNDRRYTTLSGVVTDDLSGDRFRMRSGGRNITVYVRDEPRRLSRGDRVVVSGHYNDNGSGFIANSLRITDNNSYDHDWHDRDRNYDHDYNRGRNDRDWSYGDGNLRTLSGVVTDDLSGDRFRMRSNGRDFIVYMRGDEPGRLSRGDRVVVHGRYNSNGPGFIAHSVRITNNR